MYENGMEKLSGTMSGIWSNFLDNTDMALASFGETVIEVLNLKQVLKDIVDQIEAATEWFNELSESQQKMLLTLTGITAALGPAIFLLGSLGVAIGAISGPMIAVAAGVAAGTTAIIRNWEEIEEYFTSGGGHEMWMDLKETVENAVQLIKDVWRLFGDDIIAITESTFSTVEVLISNSLKQINSFVGFSAKLFAGNLSGAFDEVVTSFKDMGIGLKDLAIALGEWLWSINPPRIAITTLQDLFTETEEKAWQFGDTMLNVSSRVNDGLRNITGQGWSMVDEFNNALDEISGRGKIEHGGIRIPVSIPEDEIISELDKIEASINGTDLSLASKIFPP
ncbi:MAG TPA: hypothetical protein DD671_10635, partial [Balneolaceae bacterium]|nr:hypothetical protein [Balneolaceae bacterium]